MKKCLNCGAEIQDDTLEFCDCGGFLVTVEEKNEPIVIPAELNVSQDDSTDSKSNEVNQVDVFQEIQDSEDAETTEEDVNFLDNLEKLKIEEGDDVTNDLDALNLLQDEESLNDEKEETTQEKNVFPENVLEDIRTLNIVPEFIEDDEFSNNDFSKIVVEEDNENNEDDDIISSVLLSIEFKDSSQEDEKASEGNTENVQFTYEPIDEKVRIEVYKLKKKIIDKEFSFDEIVVGRSAIDREVDINLRDFDTEKLVSRKHLKIFKLKERYYASRITKKTPVYLNSKCMMPNEVYELHDADKIIITREIGLIIRKAN